MKHLIISNPLGCPFRINGICSIDERDWDEVAPDCPALRFPSFCPLHDYEPSEEERT